MPELADIQGNVLNGYGFDAATYLLLAAESAGAARSCLGRLADRVTTAAPWPDDAAPATALNVAVTAAGFARLGMPPDLLARFPEAFRTPPRERADRLGDLGRGAPEHWDPGLGTGEVHLMVAVSGRTARDRDDALAEVRDGLGGGLTVVRVEEVHALPGRREHFGYADGFAQPDVEGAPQLSSRRSARARGGGVPRPGSGWRPVRLGEFVLGYPDEDGQVAVDPSPGLVRNGSYLVLRKLHQDVARFRAALAAAAEGCGLSEELVAAKLVGRWRDGVPLVLAPDREPEGSLAGEAEAAPSNDFRYLPHDRSGAACPVGAHIRRANPRDAFDFGGVVHDSGALTARHRMIRRGMPYGDVLPEGADDDGAPRGLLFVAFVADIERQFEFVQSAWCGDGDAFGLGDDRDFVLAPDTDGGGTGKLTIPVAGGPPRFADAPGGMVLTRGAEYLFAPGVRALHRLAAGSFD